MAVVIQEIFLGVIAKTILSGKVRQTTSVGSIKITPIYNEDVSKYLQSDDPESDFLQMDEGGFLTVD